MIGVFEQKQKQQQKSVIAVWFLFNFARSLAAQRFSQFRVFYIYVLYTGSSLHKTKVDTTPLHEHE